MSADTPSLEDIAEIVDDVLTDAGLGVLDSPGVAQIVHDVLEETGIGLGDSTPVPGPGAG
jgi:hypothetical protein